MIRSISARYEAELHRETMQTELVYGAAQHHQLAVWSSGTIRAQGARGLGLNSRNGPGCRFVLIVAVVALFD